MTSIPCLATVDVCVVGGSAAGAAAAIAAARAGARTLILAERTYLGDDIAGTLELWAGAAPAHPLARELWPDQALPCTPLHAKATLEQAAIAAGIELVYATGPTHVLRDAAGRVAGVAVATGGGPAAVAARVVIDATRNRLVARAAGLAAPAGGSRELSLVVIGAAPSAADERLGEIAIPKRSEGPAAVWRLRQRSDLGDGSALRWGHADSRLRDAAFTSGQLRAGDLVIDGDAIAPESWAADGLAIAPGPGLPPAARVAAGDALGAEAARRAKAQPEAKPVRAEAAGSRPVAGLRWLPSALRFNHLPRLDLPGIDSVPDLGAWDVLVLGGGTAGAPAGISSSRDGARTLVVEAAPGLGGVGTQGMISCYFDGNRVGFTREIDRGVAAMGPGGDPDSGKWNVEWKMAWYLRQLCAAGADVWLGVRGAGCIAGDGRIAGAVIATPWGAGSVACGAAVDASGCATLPAAYGAATTAIGAEHVAVQGTGLSPRDPVHNYRNSDWTFVDDADPVDVTRAYAAARRKWAGEFDVAQLVDSRERRQIVSELDLNALDILAQRTFPDTVCTARSSFDTHGFTIHPVFMVEPPLQYHGKYTAHIPLRSLLPRGLEGVLVTGLGMGAHRDAIPVVRMQPDVQNAGWAAGLFASRAARGHGGRIRAVPVREIQARLVELGNLDPAVPGHVDSFPVPDAEIDAAIAAGLPDHKTLALVFAEPARSAPRLRAALAGAERKRRERFAMTLGLMGDAAGAATLLESIAATPWDEGWNYRGMGQFGRSMSHLDGLLVAIGRTGERGAAPLLSKKLDELGSDSAFSHVRAAAVACTAVGDPAVLPHLARVLALHGMGGHSQGTLAAATAGIDGDGCATLDRNQALRELALARALWQLGDHQGLGERTLRAYADDLRGIFARHARAVLAEPKGGAARWTAARRMAAA